MGNESAGRKRYWAKHKAQVVLRLLRGEDLDFVSRELGITAHKRPGRPHGPKAHNGTIRTGRVDEMWGTDMTTTMTLSEGNASIFFAIDHCSLELVGIHAARRGTRLEALEPIRQGVRRNFGVFGKDVAADLTLRHDHGSQFISEDFQREIAFLGIKDSPSYVREPQGNGIAERFVRILKENLLWCGPSRPSRTCGKAFWPSRKLTTPAGGSGGTASGRPSSTGRNSFQLSAKRRELDAKLSKKP